MGGRPLGGLRPRREDTDTMARYTKAPEPAGQALADMDREASMDETTCPYGHYGCRTDYGYCLDEVLGNVERLTALAAERAMRGDLGGAVHARRHRARWQSRLSARER